MAAWSSWDHPTRVRRRGTGCQGTSYGPWGPTRDNAGAQGGKQRRAPQDGGGRGRPRAAPRGATARGHRAGRGLRRGAVEDKHAVLPPGPCTGRSQRQAREPGDRAGAVGRRHLPARKPVAVAGGRSGGPVACRQQGQGAAGGRGGQSSRTKGLRGLRMAGTRAILAAELPEPAPCRAAPQAFSGERPEARKGGRTCLR